MPRTPAERWIVVAVLAAIILAAFWAYAPALHGPFVYDDHYFVAQNDAIMDARRAGDWLVDPATASEGKRWGTIFRPVRTVSYALDFGGWRHNPFGYHLTSLLIHCAAITGVFALALRLTGSAGGALLGAAIFALHPLPAEAGLFIGARSDVLAAIPVLSLALLTLRPGPRTPQRYAAELALVLVSVACKEPAAAAVPALALALWLRDREPGAFWRAFRWSLGGVGVIVAYGILRTAALGLTSQYDFLAHGDPGLTWGSALRIRVFELGQILRPNWLSPSHLDLPVMDDWGDAGFWLALIATLGVGWLAWRCRRIAPAATVGMVWWVLFLLPASQLLPINMLTSDRWLYLPFAGLAAIVAAAVGAADRTWGTHARRTLLAVGAVWVAVCAAQTRARAADWADPVRLWETAVEAWPEDPSNRVGLTSTLLNRATRREAVDPAAAERDRRAAIDAALELAARRPSATWLAAAAAHMNAIDRPWVARRILAPRVESAELPNFELVLRLAAACWLCGDQKEADRWFGRLTAPDSAIAATVDRVRRGEVFYTETRGEGHDPGPSRALAWLERARLAYADNRLDVSDRSVRAALQAWPESQMAVWARATLLRQVGRVELGGATIEKVWQQAEVQPLFELRAELAGLMGWSDVALRSHARAVERWPFAPELWTNLADQHRRRGEAEFARACFARQEDLAR